MKLGVLISERSWYWRDLQRAAAGLCQLQALSFASLTATVGRSTRIATAELADLSQLDAVLVRSMPPGSLEQVVFRMNALHRLARAGTRVCNSPRSLEVAIDKYLALTQLQAAGLPVPETRTSQTWEQAMQDFTALGGDVVVKPLFGGEGRGITRVQDEAVAGRVFRAYAQLGMVIYQQRFIAHPGYDLRILVIGSQLYGIRRRNEQDWRTNISRGAEAEPLEISDELAGWSRRAADAVGASIAGIDILPSVDGQKYVLEVNAVPGWRAVASALKQDIARRVLQWILGLRPPLPAPP
jgi:ribosomal protein S6--L-glutamate ligase